MRHRYQNNSAAAQQYDAQIALRSDALPGRARAASTSKDMKTQGWQIFDTGPADHLSQRARGAGQEGRLRRLLLGDGGGHLPHHLRPARAADRADHVHRRLFQVPDPD